MNNLLSNILIATGLFFSLMGCIGLIKLPDIYNRLQAATKCVTLGACCILFSLVIRFGISEPGIKGLFAIPVLFFTSTVGAHALIRGSHIFGIKLWEKSIIDEYRKDTNDKKVSSSDKPNKENEIS